MTRWYRPLPLIGAEDAVPLAGQKHVRFTQVAGPDGVVSVHDISSEVRDRLTAPRAEVAGLSLDRPRIMGILNVTPDSFSDGGQHNSLDGALARATAMAQDADILDIGGESTRPGADDVDVAEEIQRTAPVIRAIRDAGIATPISIDTRKAAVARAALEAGADMVNDVSAFTYDPELADLVAETDAPVCLMHAKGTPKDMQAAPRYDDVVAEVMDHLAERIDFAMSRGIKRDRIIPDPGIGFGKTGDHNLILLRHLSVLHDLGLPMLLGASRKRFIGTIGGAEDAQARMPGSVSVAMWGVAQGAQILRVHDVAETAQALRLWMAMA
ncbi:dihydropteroate synthase [Pseudooceanicola sp. MF1-13]|uniref:dihydropteroate synthase n=1 Tax=Pseudooceanicola sp. MF1-13 TaxID=3379095 RepID=UPI00389163D1